MSSRIPITWILREPPLEPLAVAARGAAAARLAARLLDCSDDQLGALRGSTSVGGEGEPDVVVLLGAADALPWCDGVVYLGRDDEAPSLLMPTTERPSVAPALLERAVRQHTQSDAPMAIVPAWSALVDVSSAQSLARESLREWQERRR